MRVKINLSIRQRSSDLFDAICRALLGQFVSEVFGVVCSAHKKAAQFFQRHTKGGRPYSTIGGSRMAVLLSHGLDTNGHLGLGSRSCIIRFASPGLSCAWAG